MFFQEGNSGMDCYFLTTLPDPPQYLRLPSAVCLLPRGGGECGTVLHFKFPFHKFYTMRTGEIRQVI